MEYNRDSNVVHLHQRGGKISVSDENHPVRGGTLHNDKGTWCVRARVYDPALGRYRARSRSTGIKVKEHRKREAEKMKKDILAQWEKEVLEAAEASTDTLFSGYVWRWLDGAAKRLKATTVKTYKEYALSYVLPALGDRKVPEMRVRHLQDFCDELLERMSVSSVKKIFVVVTGALEEAVFDDAIAANFSSSVRFPKAEKFKGQAYTGEQVGILLQAAERAGEPLRSAVVLGACYGLRRSEVLGLRWSDVDFEKGTLNVINTVTQNGDLRIEEEKTKTAAGKRVIALLGTTVPYFERLRRTQEENGLTLDKVCVWPDGREVFGDYLTKRIPKLMEAAGLPVIRFHDLRHTAASLLAREATPKQVQEFLGHENISTTLNIYTHQDDEDRQKTAELMDGILSKIS